MRNMRHSKFRALLFTLMLTAVGCAPTVVVTATGTSNSDRPIPSHVTYEQAKGFAESFLHGQPRRAMIASTLFRDKLDQMKA